jgi:hypothetical protein
MGAWGHGSVGALDAVDAWTLWTPGGCGRLEAVDAWRLWMPGGCGCREPGMLKVAVDV